MPETPRDVTQLLEAIGRGNGAAADDLLPLVYEELRRLARARISREPAQTLQATALVHEAYLRLVGPDDKQQWENRGHFFGAAALAMRRILVERARQQQRLKHGGGRQRVEFDEEVAQINPQSTDLVALDTALDKLQRRDPRKAEVVMLRYFAGLSIEETARAMGLSPATVKNEWTVARALLHRELSRDEGEV